MKIYNLYDNKKFIDEYARLCVIEWGKTENKSQLELKIKRKINKLLDGDDNLISCLILVDEDKLVGFISLFKNACTERQDLTPWYATMYVKNIYRGNGYSRILNNAILNEAKKLGYNKVFLKSDLVNYYEKFGALYIEDLNDGEALYYIDLKDV